jgi:hypothetical protein
MNPLRKAFLFAWSNSIPSTDTVWPTLSVRRSILPVRM